MMHNWNWFFMMRDDTCVVWHDMFDGLVRFKYHDWLFVYYCVSHFMMGGSVVVCGNNMNRLVIGCLMAHNFVVSRLVTRSLVYNLAVNSLMMGCFMYDRAMDGLMTGCFMYDRAMNGLVARCFMNNLSVHSLVARRFMNDGAMNSLVTRCLM